MTAHSAFTDLLRGNSVTLRILQACILLMLVMPAHLEEGSPTTVDCKNPPDSPNTQHQLFKTTPGSSANYTCDVGFVKVKGDESLICDETGTWSGEVLVCSEAASLDASNGNNTKNITDKDMEDNSSKGNTGAVVAASVIAVVIIIILVVGVYIFKRKRQSRMMDKEKKMQIQMSSARNAGVYQDLTVSVPAEDKPPASPEHERLKAAEDA